MGDLQDEAVLAASFQDCVLIDVAMQVAPEIEVVFLDTQYHFAETLWYVEQVRERYDLNLRVITPQIEPDNLWQIDTDACCEMRKVEPLARALEGKAAWLTGLRRDEASTRANAPIVGCDIGRGIVKVNPIAPWTHDDIDGYVARPRPPAAPAARQGLPVDRLLAVHATGRRRATTRAPAAGPAAASSSAASTAGRRRHTQLERPRGRGHRLRQPKPRPTNGLVRRIRRTRSRGSSSAADRTRSYRRRRRGRHRQVHPAARRPTGADCVAVEPVDGMRAVLGASVPGVPARAGAAEALPFADGSLDAITVAQAFHWFDAARGAARVPPRPAPGRSRRPDLERA